MFFIRSRIIRTISFQSSFHKEENITRKLLEFSLNELDTMSLLPNERGVSNLLVAFWHLARESKRKFRT